MAAVQRLLCLSARRAFSTSRTAFSLSKDTSGYGPDPLEHASGMEKKQLLAELAGNDDPFDMKVSKRGVGTKDKPNIVFSAQHERIVGCICEDDATSVKWMWLKKDEMKRCECGHYFKLQYKPSIL